MSISDYIDNISSSIVKLSGGLNNDVFTETDSETILRKYHNSINFQSKNYELKLIKSGHFRCFNILTLVS